MLMDADIAMYQVKQRGKNDFKYYNPEMDRQIRKRLQIEQQLRTALENGELRLVYQPLIRAGTGEIRGFEALLRWESKELGQVSPLDFIPIAEETGMIIKIGEWVLKSACEMIRSINFAYGTDYVMSVNVSPVEINHPMFLNHIYDIVKETGIRNEWIEIEITENVLLTNIDQIISIIIHLSSAGITVSLDDFGTGYSSLSYLNKLPVGTLKIDREFINELIHSKNSQKMVDSIILLAHKLGMFLVAEGVENKEQVKMLEAFSCDCLQGYYFSKPLEPDKLREFIEGAGNDPKPVM
jgi:EAL domain-containing protein (putative c-di-GMP-specific phosphodiesterase class I)